MARTSDRRYGAWSTSAYAPKSEGVKVLVVGGGVIGVAAALEMRARGADVEIVERGNIGGEASSVAAGILGAQAEAHEGESDRALFARIAARDSYAEWCAAIEAKSSQNTGYLRSGVISIARHGAELDALTTAVAHQRALGLHADVVDPKSLRALEPNLTPDAIGGAFFQDDAQVEPAKLMSALAALVPQENIRVHREEVTELIVANNRCHGARTKTGQIHADSVVVCTGAFTSYLNRGSAPMPDVEPVRGQLITLRDDTINLTHVVFGAGGYIVPRGDGRLVCGTTEEHVGFERGPTSAGIERVRSIAKSIAPHTEQAKTLTATANFRPFVKSGPMIEETKTRGLYVATGHHRNGILLAKWTADRVATLVLETK